MAAMKWAGTNDSGSVQECNCIVHIPGPGLWYSQDSAEVIWLFFYLDSLRGPCSWKLLCKFFICLSYWNEQKIHACWLIPTNRNVLFWLTIGAHSQLLLLVLFGPFWTNLNLLDFQMFVHAAWLFIFIECAKTVQSSIFVCFWNRIFVYFWNSQLKLRDSCIKARANSSAN